MTQTDPRFAFQIQAASPLYFQFCRELENLPIMENWIANVDANFPTFADLRDGVSVFHRRPFGESLIPSSLSQYTQSPNVFCPNGERLSGPEYSEFCVTVTDLLRFSLKLIVSPSHRTLFLPSNKIVRSLELKCKTLYNTYWAAVDAKQQNLRLSMFPPVSSADILGDLLYFAFDGEGSKFLDQEDKKRPSFPFDLFAKTPGLHCSRDGFFVRKGLMACSKVRLLHRHLFPSLLAALFRCSLNLFGIFQCRISFYCTFDHQQESWKFHKKICYKKV